MNDGENGISSYFRLLLCKRVQYHVIFPMDFSPKGLGQVLRGCLLCNILRHVPVPIFVFAIMRSTVSSGLPFSCVQPIACALPSLRAFHVLSFACLS